MSQATVAPAPAKKLHHEVGAVCEPTTLQAIRLGYEIGEKKILTDVNATFKPRKMTAVMGPSGARRRLRGSSYVRPSVCPTGLAQAPARQPCSTPSPCARAACGRARFSSTVRELRVARQKRVPRHSDVARQNAPVAVVHAAGRHPLPATDCPAAVVRCSFLVLVHRNAGTTPLSCAFPTSRVRPT